MVIYPLKYENLSRKGLRFSALWEQEDNLRVFLLHYLSGLGSRYDNRF